LAALSLETSLGNGPSGLVNTGLSGEKQQVSDADDRRVWPERFGHAGSVDNLMRH